MLSRVADCIFWMSRYIERAENVARFIDVNEQLTLDLVDAVRQQWAPLVSITGDYESFKERHGEATRETVLGFLTFDPENPNSILGCLQRARENARTIREQIPSPTWEELNKFYLMVKQAAADGQALDQPYEFLNQVKRRSHLLIGIIDATMSHGEAWHFSRLGRKLERADKTSRILDVKYFLLLPSTIDVGTPLDIVQWSALLKSAGALEMYRRTYGRILPSKVVDFLILDREFPRSMRFCIAAAEESLHVITGTSHGTFSNKAEQYLGRLRSELDFTHVDDIIGQGLHEFVDGVQDRLNNIGAAIHECFFTSQRLALDQPRERGK